MGLSRSALQLLWKLKTVRSLQRKMRGRVSQSKFEAIPGMTTLEERNYYYELSKQLEGAGQIVDLGCWLGSTTLPLLAGLHDKNDVPQNEIKVFAFDKFIWEPEMQEPTEWYSNAPKLKVGEGFESVLKQNIEPYLNLAKIVKTDLETYHWNYGPIELLLVDAMKSLPLTVQISRSFFPSVVPGKGYIIFQDFAHYYTPWLHLITYEIQKMLQPVCNIPHSGSMVFKLKHEIKVEDLNFLSGIGNYNIDFIRRVFAYSLSLVHEENKPKILAAKAMWFVHNGEMEEAKRIYRDEIQSVYVADEDVKAMRKYLTP